MVIVDASTVVCLLAERPVEAVQRLVDRLLDEELHAPHLIDVEVAHALRRFVLLGIVTAARAEIAFSDLAALPLNRHPHFPFLADIWRMRSSRTAYDAAYVALAESLGAPLITLDARMARTAATVAIEVF
jgi:predicted nucleic acid-binding protein